MGHLKFSEVIIVIQISDYIFSEFKGDKHESLVLARSACLRYAGCEHFVSALRPLALGWGKVPRILQIYAFVPFYTGTAYQLITIGPRFYKNVIIFLFSHKRQQILIIYC